MTDRLELGAEKVGEPIETLRDAVNILGTVEFEDVRIDAIDHYIQLFLMSFVPGTIDEALSDQQLEKLDADVVKQVAFLLLAHAIADLREHLVDAEKHQADPQWHQQLIRRIAKLAQIEETPLVEHALRPLPEDIVNDPLLVDLSQKMEMEVVKFFIIQPAMVEVVIEDVITGVPDDDDDDFDFDGLEE